MEQQWIRMHGVKMVRAGMSASDVARHFDVSVRAALKWVAAFYDGGQKAGERIRRIYRRHAGAALPAALLRYASVLRQMRRRV
ncbi:helix-turn-helix domain-containing protein [Accumulibacter sp.]